MRNLKKVLALVLVLVMTMSVMTFAGAYSDVDNSEAINVMSAVGVFNGYEDGTFKPNKVLTREEAMKIVSYLDLTKSVADTLPKDGGVFTDVEAGRWSAGYIAYAYNVGVVNGNGDGTFGPSDELTGYAFAKMILNVLGIEGEYTGLLWQVNIKNALAANKALLAGLEKVDLSLPMTRGQAAQMAFNALWVTTGADVATGKYIIEVKAGSEFAAELNEIAKIKFETSLEAMLTVSSVCEDAKLGKDYTVVEEYAPDYTKALAGDHDVRPYTTTDEFGIDTTGHCSITVDKKGNPVAVYTANTESGHTYAYGVKVSELYKALGLKKDTEVEYWVNGVEGTLTLTEKGKTVIGGEGVSVEVIGSKIVVISTYALGQVVKVVEAVEADPAKGVEAKDAYVVLHNDETLVTDEYVEGDYILCTKANGEVVDHWAADVVEGKVEKRTSSYVVVAGEKYTVAKTTGELVYGEEPFKNAYEYYVCDGVVYDSVNKYQPEDTKPGKITADEFVYVTDLEYTYVNKSATAGSMFVDPTEAEVSFAVKVRYYDLEGAEYVVELPVKDVTKKGDANPTFSFVSYTGETVKVELTETKANVATKLGAWAALKDDAFVKMADVDGAYVTVLETAVAKKDTVIDGLKATKNTTYTLINPVTEENTELTGTKIEIAEGAYVLILTEAKGKIVTAVYEMSFVKPEPKPETSNASYAYAIEKGDEIAEGVYEWKFFVGGKVETLSVSAEGVEAGYVYELTLTDGVVTAVSTGVKVEEQGVVTLVYDEFFEVNEETFVYYGKDCAVYNLADYTEDTLELKDKIFVVATDKDGAATLIYIVG